MKVISEIKKLLKNRALIKRMTRKELTDRYAGSFFGLAWTFLQPLFIITVYVIVFTFVFKIRIGGEGKPIDYAFYAVSGLLPWLAIADGLSKSVSAVYSKAALVKQAIFPVETLPVSAVLSSFIPISIGLIFYIVGFLFFDPSTLMGLYLLPLTMIIHFIFIVGVGYLLAIVGVYFRDLSEFITMILTVGMFVTPILYLESSIPTKLVWIVNLNPATHIINMYRDALFYGQMQHPWSFVLCAISAVIFFVLGITAFNKVKPLFSNVL